MICHGLLFLCLYVFSDDFFIHLATGLGKIAIRPEAVAPKEFFKLWELFTNHAACAVFQYLHDFGDSFAWLNLNQDVHMVILNV